jgi:hypothetical protein
MLDEVSERRLRRERNPPRETVGYVKNAHLN